MSSFPSKLYEMLESVESLGLSSAVSWLPRGRGFTLIDCNLLMKEVVPLFFEISTFRVFVKQLHLWGFQK